MRPVQIQMAVMRVSASASSGVSMGLKSPKDLNDTDIAHLMGLLGTVSDVLLVPIDAGEAEAYKVDKEMETKTPSQRLRNTLFVYWKQQGEKGDFNDFYRVKMDMFIDAIKEKLGE